MERRARDEDKDPIPRSSRICGKRSFQYQGGMLRDLI